MTVFKDKWKEIEDDARQGNYWERHEGNKQKLFSIGRRHQFLIDKIGQETPKNALEIGAGRGIIGIMVSKECDCKVTSVDLNPGYVALGNETNRFLEGNCRFVQGDVFDLQFDETYDVIFSQGFIHHFPPKKATELMRRMQRIGKVNIHSVPSHNHPALPSRTEYFQEDEVEIFQPSNYWKEVFKQFNCTAEYYSHDLEGRYEGIFFRGVSICIWIR